ncbi:hypothetical protein [Chryseobacterium shandongense]|uniref:TerB N-terminal domain-containing protein n=1 Tax=Chryseobacterium shandongense TaxID=1493872 RepID=A0ABM7BAB7_9FLAO|nr:hypothetical protein [Chryseobacterium shandongense]AZA95630.1 hypothetical protein EG353_08650 [Chryseobacterium shandongense]
MNYATTYHIGNDQPTRKQTATAVAPTVGRVQQVATKAKRRKPSAERQTEVRTDSHAANGILKCTFLPKLKTAQPVQACEKTERDFYKSLSELAEHYSIEPMQTKDYGFPYNIALSMWDMETKVKRTNINWDRFQLVQDRKKTFFITEERYNVGTTLYYVPVVPLFRMLRDRERKRTAQLLLSVFSYLYHIADIPYYRQEDSYLYWQYEMHREWVEQDEQMDATETYIRELTNAEHLGGIMAQKVFNRNNLTYFEQRLSRFNSRDAFDRECQKVACDVFALYTEYPNATMFRNAPLSEEDPYNQEHQVETIGMEKYISFIADTKGGLYESLTDCINNEFNEYGLMEEPTIFKAFDGSSITEGNLDFENRLFALLDDLCTVLYEYKRTRK